MIYITKDLKLKTKIFLKSTLYLDTQYLKNYNKNINVFTIIFRSKIQKFWYF